jgi:hypothetical protein
MASQVMLCYAKSKKQLVDSVSHAFDVEGEDSPFNRILFFFSYNYC